jgi:hypothetical protein
MIINGKWMNEPEIRAYIKQLESENQKLKEELKNIIINNTVKDDNDEKQKI